MDAGNQALTVVSRPAAAGNGAQFAEGMDQLLSAPYAVGAGDFSVRLPGNQVGLAGKISDTFHVIVSAKARMASELEQVRKVIGREGRTGKRIRFDVSSGAWGV